MSVRKPSSEDLLFAVARAEKDMARADLLAGAALVKGHRERMEALQQKIDAVRRASAKLRDDIANMAHRHGKVGLFWNVVTFGAAGAYASNAATLKALQLKAGVASQDAQVAGARIELVEAEKHIDAQIEAINEAEERQAATHDRAQALLQKISESKVRISELAPRNERV